jgi:hypothetical protein
LAGASGLWFGATGCFAISFKSDIGIPACPSAVLRGGDDPINLPRIVK